MISPDQDRRIPIAVWLTTALLLILAAVGSWPYGFYMLLRLVVCVASIFIAWRLGQHRPLMWVFIFIAILYNPVFRVAFERDTWSILNVVSALPYVVVGFLQRPRKSDR